MKWLKKTLRREQRELEHARRRFIRRPDEAHLHDVRTAGRRFRSLLEDVAVLVQSKRLRRRVKRAAAATDAARDTAILVRLLEVSVGDAEAALARPLLERLRAQEHRATRDARKELRRTHFAP
ncbi:MAG TPA: CHAD domain-containing protein [Candidatus Cybelea sp.]|jgi:hypothetical protein|nr:CHAD domain-containing protein [Candidatus Cybelea sp.]